LIDPSAIENTHLNKTEDILVNYLYYVKFFLDIFSQFHCESFLNEEHLTIVFSVSMDDRWR